MFYCRFCEMIVNFVFVSKNQMKSSFSRVDFIDDFRLVCRGQCRCLQSFGRSRVSIGCCEESEFQVIVRRMGRIVQYGDILVSYVRRNKVVCFLGIFVEWVRGFGVEVGKVGFFFILGECGGVFFGVGFFFLVQLGVRGRFVGFLLQDILSDGEQRDFLRGLYRVELVSGGREERVGRLFRVEIKDNGIRFLYYFCFRQ